MILLKVVWFLSLFPVSPILASEDGQTDIHNMDAVSSLLSTCSLTQYIPKFKEDGYDNINYLKTMSKDEFGQEMSEMEMKKGEWRRLYKRLHAKENNLPEISDPCVETEDGGKNCKAHIETEPTFKKSEDKKYADSRLPVISTYKLDPQDGPIQAMASVSITIPHRANIPRPRFKTSTTQNIIVISNNQQQLYAIDAIDNKILSSFSSGHTQSITQIKISRGVDTYMMTGSLDGVCNGYLLATWFQRILFPEDEFPETLTEKSPPPKMRLSPTMEPTRRSTSTLAKIKFNHEFSTKTFVIDGKVSAITALDVYQSGRMLYFMAAYDDGHIRVFSRDGELKSELTSENTTVNAVVISLSRKRLFFSTELGLGQMRILPTRRERLVMSTFCLLDDIVSITLSAENGNYLYVATMNGTVNVIKMDTLRQVNSSSPCRILFQLSIGSGSPVELVAQNGYLYITSTSFLHVYNITNARKKPSLVMQREYHSIEDNVSPFIAAMTSDERETFIVVAKGTDGEIICHQTYLHFLFRETASLFTGMFSSIGFPTRFPIVIIPVVGVLLYKFVFKKKAKQPEFPGGRSGEYNLPGRSERGGSNRRRTRPGMMDNTDSFESWKSQKERRKGTEETENLEESVEAMQSRVESLYKSMESAQEQLKSTTDSFSKMSGNRENEGGGSHEQGNSRGQRKQGLDETSEDDLD